MNIHDYFLAGYHGRTSEEPPYPSSPVYMAYQAGKWCREHGITALEIKAGRGYKMLVNRTLVLDYKKNDQNPVVTRLAR
jgi:hypothetical protein